MTDPAPAEDIGASRQATTARFDLPGARRDQIDVATGTPTRWTSLPSDCSPSSAQGSRSAGWVSRASGIMVCVEGVALPVTPAVVGGSTR
jgi:hypothetical protein